MLVIKIITREIETHADDCEDVAVDVERALVDSAREGGREALGESLGDNQLPWDLGEGRVRLKGLMQVASSQRGKADDGRTRGWAGLIGAS